MFSEGVCVPFVGLCLTHHSFLCVMLRYGEHSFKNGKYWDSKADPSVSIDGRRIDYARKEQLVDPTKGKSRCQGKRGDANVLFGQQGQKFQVVSQPYCVYEKLKDSVEYTR